MSGCSLSSLGLSLTVPLLLGSQGKFGLFLGGALKVCLSVSHLSVCVCWGGFFLRSVLEVCLCVLTVCISSDGNIVWGV